MYETQTYGVIYQYLDTCSTAAIPSPNTMYDAKCATHKSHRMRDVCMFLVWEQCSDCLACRTNTLL